MSAIASLAAVLAVAASALLVAVVLLQDPRGSGLAGALGRSGDEALGATATRGVRRLTGWLAGAWLVACVVSAIAL